MKRLAVLVFAACSAAASESFILGVPVGEDLTRLTSEVRVILTLSAPAAGSSLVVNGATTVTLGQTVTISGDTLTYEAAGANSARITFRPVSNFPMPNNFCFVDPNNVTPKELQIRFNGSQDVVSYRISSYTVGAPGVECSKPFKRVADFPASIAPVDDGVAPPLSATFQGRLPLDVVLVLDKSGSMSELPPGAEGGANKAAILKSALSAFIVQWRQLDAPVFDEETGMLTGIENSEDRIGVVFFDSTAVGQSIAGAEAPANFFVLRGAGPSDPAHPWTAVSNTIQTLTPGGSTSIGGGINEGMRLWANDPDHDLSMVVVTDGKQNVEPLIGETADGFLTLTPVSGFDTQLRRRFVPIQSIAFGLPTGVDQELLDKLAQETNGRTFVAIDAATIFNTFGQTLVAILKGNTIATILRHDDTMSGAGPASREKLVVDRSIPRVVVSLQWAPPLSDVLDLEVLDPSGNVITPTETAKLPQAVILRFDTGPSDAGDWSVRVKRAQSAATQPIPYTLTAFAVEDELEYRVSTGDAVIATGDTVPIRVSVTYAGRPLNKLPNGAIRVRVQKPAEGLGTILHNARGTDTSAPAPAGDTRTPYDRKVSGLTTAQLLQRITPRDAGEITLTEEKPGIYVGTFGDTNVPGAYGFEVLLDWTDPRTGHLRREERVETQVKVRPTATVVTVTRGDDGRTRVTATPRDRFGNYLGPGYEHRVKARLTSAGTISTTAVDPDQTGTYVFTIDDVPAGETPAVTVTVDGVEATPGTPPSTGGTNGWRVFIDAGPNFPLSALSNRADGGLSINAGLERRLSNRWSAELILGHHNFEGIQDPRMWQFSIGGKFWFNTGTLRPFLGLSAGAYLLEPGTTTRAGGSAAGGVLFELTPRLGIEGVYSYHVVNTEHDSLSFAALQAGIRFSF
jgi:von Willebrand factor type A domain